MNKETEKDKENWGVVPDNPNFEQKVFTFSERLAQWFFSEEERRPISWIMAYFLVITIAGSLMLFAIEFLRFRGGF
jgi:hypothetical protein|tara:strand:+ start:1271 stop:1498 length:228 start_codon:yes stop_codon:yes gene_type:complete